MYASISHFHAIDMFTEPDNFLVIAANTECSRTFSISKQKQKNVSMREELYLIAHVRRFETNVI